MMNAFRTLLWLELRKFGAIGLGLLLGVAIWFLVARQIFEWNGANLESVSAVFIVAMLVAVALSTAFLVVLGLDFSREYRAGRWPLLLGSPQPGWLHLAAKAVFGMGVLTLFNGGLWLGQIYWLDQAGVGLPFMLGLGVWLYLLGGLALVVPALFLGLWVSAYIPGRAIWIAFLVGIFGFGQLVEWIERLLRDQLYQLLPPWKLPLPRFENPSAEQGEGFAVLPAEGFVLLLILTALFFVAASRLWQEVEA